MNNNNNNDNNNKRSVYYDWHFRVNAKSKTLGSCTIYQQVTLRYPVDIRLDNLSNRDVEDKPKIQKLWENFNSLSD